MAFELKPGQGSLWKNDYKKADNQPDYRGTYANADGEVCNISAWIKKSAKGETYMSFSLEFEPWQKEGGGLAGADVGGSNPGSGDSDVPF